MSVFAKRLKQARLEAGLSQEGLGVLAGIDEASASPRMNQYERAVHAPDFSIVEKIAAVLNLPTAYFYAAEDDVADLLREYHRLPDVEKKKLMSTLTGKKKKN